MKNRRAAILLGLAILAGLVCFLVMDTLARGRSTAPEAGPALFCPASMYAKPESDSYQFQDVSFGPITLRLPNTFKPATGSFIHGGSAWSDGERRVEILNGHYGFSSFPEPASACALQLSGQRAFVAQRDTEEGTELAILLLTKCQGDSEPLLLLKSRNRRDLPLLYQIGLGLRYDREARERELGNTTPDR